MSDDSLAEASVAASAWRELVADAPDVVIKADNIIATLAEAAHRHDVMVSITISPYRSDEDVE